MKKQDSAHLPEEDGAAKFHIRLPGFVSDQQIGLGDVVKRATSAVGIRPCGGCVRRAQALNRLIMFSGRRERKVQ
jgi:hypothetical protein